MIDSLISALFNFIMSFLVGLMGIIVDLVFSVLGVFPDLPDSFVSVVDYCLEFIINGLPILGCFFDLTCFRVCIPIVLIVDNIEELYFIIMWCIKKIPFLNMK